MILIMSRYQERTDHVDCVLLGTPSGMCVRLYTPLVSRKPTQYELAFCLLFTLPLNLFILAGQLSIWGRKVGM